MRSLLRIAAIAALACFGSYVFAQDQDIVVNGKLPKMAAGEWEVRETLPARMRGQSVETRQPQKVCVGDRNGLSALQSVLERQRREGMMEKCSTVTIDLKNDRLSGRRRCSTISVDFSYRYSGIISDTSFEIDEYTDVLNRSGGRSSGRKTIIGRLIGPCEKSEGTVNDGSTAAAIPLAVPPLSTRQSLSSEVETRSPQSVAPIARSAEISPSIIAPARPSADVLTPSVPQKDNGNEVTSQDEIVVLARSFQRMKLSIRKVSRSERFCRATESSGDKKIDRIGCSVLLRCIERGFVEKQEVTMCVNKRMDELFPRGKRD